MFGRTINTFVCIILAPFLFDCGYTKLSTTKLGDSSLTTQYPEPFEVIYKSANNEFNSANSYIKKDLVLDGFAKASFSLSDNDKIRIYEIAKDIDWITLPGSIGMTSVSGSNQLWIRFGDIEKNVSWHFSGDSPKNENEKLLMKLEIILKDILYNNSAYRSLPKPRGGRL